jgi:hypothetical protein
MPDLEIERDDRFIAIEHVLHRVAVVVMVAVVLGVFGFGPLSSSTTAREVLHANLDQHRINVNDIMEEARRASGVRSLGDIDHAVLERSGDIAIIPRT